MTGRRVTGRLGVIVVNYGSHDLIASNLPSETTETADALVVIVDNFHSDAEREATRQLCKTRNWVLVPSTNRGFGAGVNLGVATAIDHGCDVLLALNPDAHVTADVLTALADHCRAEPMSLVSPTIVDTGGRTVFRGNFVNLDNGQIRGGWSATDDPPWRRWLTGACLAFHRDAFAAAGGMSEDYFLYWEDVDFSLRASDAGVRLVVRDDLVAVHDEGGTQGRNSDAKSPLYYFYNTRNRLLFARDHAAPGQVRRWVLDTPRQSAKIWLRGGRRQALTQPSGLVAAVRGSVAGLLPRGSSDQAKPAASPNTAHPTASTGETQPTVLLAHPSPDLYGSDRVLLESVSAFTATGRRVVVALPAEGPLWDAIRDRGGEVVGCPTPVLRKSFLTPTGLVRLAAQAAQSVPPGLALIRELRPDFVLVNTVTIPLWVAIAKLGRTPVTVHVHEAEKSQAHSVRQILYLPCLLADRMVVNSRFSLDVLTDTWPALAGRSTIVYNGVPGPADPVAPPRAELDEVRLLFLGRLSPRKGPHVAVDALAKLVDAGVNARLSLLGAVFDGYEWFEDQLRASVADHGLVDRVDFLGFDPAIWEHLAASDIVLVPSTVDEPFGNTAVEAILAKRPLVVSATSGLKEAAAGYGNARFVEPEDADAIVTAVRDLVDNWPQVCAQVDADRQLALDRHAPEVYQRALVEVTDANLIHHPVRTR